VEASIQVQKAGNVGAKFIRAAKRLNKVGFIGCCINIISALSLSEITKKNNMQFMGDFEKDESKYIRIWKTLDAGKSGQ
jgi:hypothetical protein